MLYYSDLLQLSFLNSNKDYKYLLNMKPTSYYRSINQPISTKWLTCFLRSKLFDLGFDTVYQGLKIFHEKLCY